MRNTAPMPDHSGQIHDAAERDIAIARDLLAAGREDAATVLLRGVPGRAGSRPAAASLTIAASQADPRFRALVAQADAQRDAHCWEAAEVLYREALALYPLHAGYIAQLGHCLKEQDAMAEAEMAYRSSLALGAPREDVEAHIRYVCTMQGDAGAPIPQAPAPTTGPLGHPPTAADIELLFLLLRNRRPDPVREVQALLRNAPTCQAVVDALSMPEG